MTLQELQSLHVELTAILIAYAYSAGYHLSWGEAYRTPEQAALNAEKGSGIAHSLHTERLAVDLMLHDAEGNYLTDSARYLFLGDYWKILHPLCRWGGDFSHADGNHFSLEWEGRQ